MGIAARQDTPRKLDALGILKDGRVALVEVKDRGGDLVRAAWQAAVHVYNFQTRQDQPGGGITEVVEGMVDQKEQIALIPRSFEWPRVRAAFVPVIAAPQG